MRQDVLSALVASLDRREAVAVVTVTAGDGVYAGVVGRHLLVWQDHGRTPLGDLDLGDATASVVAHARDALMRRAHGHVEHTDAQGTAKLFVEVQVQPPHLLVVGAGHIAVPLAQIGEINDFEVTVLDDRPQYASRTRFPTADRVIAGPFRDELRTLRSAGKLDHHTYIVLVTRGHQHDVDCLVEVLDDPLAYIGMIGSQRRVRAVFELLEREQNIPAAKFDRVYAPVGIDIGARTPAEIAVCIMAEIINVMRKGPARSLSQQIREERQARRERVGMSAVTIEIHDPTIADVTVSDDALTVDLSDGRSISVPLAWYPRLWHGTQVERNNWRPIGRGLGIHWPELDEDVSLEGLLLGKASNESQTSLKRWLDQRCS